jgi:hypothetical protein
VIAETTAATTIARVTIVGRPVTAENSAIAASSAETKIQPGMVAGYPGAPALIHPARMAPGWRPAANAD